MSLLELSLSQPFASSPNRKYNEELHFEIIWDEESNIAIDKIDKIDSDYTDDSNLKIVAQTFKYGLISIAANKYGLNENNIDIFLSIFGNKVLYNLLNENQNIITNSLINNLLSSDKRKLYISNDKKHLLINNSNLWRTKFGKLKSISIKEAFNSFGLKKIFEVSETNITNIE